jgi:CheY-like chemotaxis protein
MRAGRTKRILLVDDSPSQLCLFAALLDSGDYELATATDGESAMATARRFVPDLIILDMKLPPWGGVEVARRLKVEPRTRDTLVLAVSGYDFELIRETASGAGITDFLQKPIDAQALRSKVAELLGRAP